MLRGDAYGYDGDGKLSGSAPRCGSAFSMNVLKICAGNVPPATGLPWYSSSIGRSRSG